MTLLREGAGESQSRAATVTGADELQVLLIRRRGAGEATGRERMTVANRQLGHKVYTHAFKRH